jgi:putative endonuclease
MWYVYILRSRKDGWLYVGSTNNLKRRLREHDSGECSSTAHRRPFELEAYIAVQHESIARGLEGYLKSGSGIATLRKRILASEAPGGVGGPCLSAKPLLPHPSG